MGIPFEERIIQTSNLVLGSGQYADRCRDCLAFQSSLGEIATDLTPDGTSTDVRNLLNTVRNIGFACGLVQVTGTYDCIVPAIRDAVVIDI